jgi:hypothetical protein
MKAEELDAVVKANYVASCLLGRTVKHFADWQFVKECLVAVSDLLFPERRRQIGDFTLFWFSVYRREDDIAESNELCLINVNEPFRIIR